MKSSQIRTEILSGLTIAVALVPESISFALLVGVAPQAGLWAAVIMALSTALIGGRPGLISGSTGATSIIMAGLFAAHGPNALYLGIVLAGVIQLLFWATSSWKIFAKIPKTVISGFLIALALMILSSQLKYVTVDEPTGLQLVATLLIITASAIAMIASSRLTSIPSAISAIVVGCLLGIPLGLSTVGDISTVSADPPGLVLPVFSIKLLIAALPYSIGMAVAGLTESLLTVDSIAAVLKERGDKARETLAQGLGNVVSGFLGTIGGCVLVGQTNLNVAAGAKHRLSGMAAALGLVLIIMGLGLYIEMIPLAGLVGVMLVVVYQTGDWSSLRNGKTHDILIIAVTVLASILTNNPAIGVIVGTLVHYCSKIY
jgi:SulP family sulfate permease